MICNSSRLRVGVAVCAALVVTALAGLGPLGQGLNHGLGFAPAWGQARALVVKSDPGGLIGQRSREIRRLMVSGERVELRGTCNSACTMYLGLSNICVDPQAHFGFHGPSWYGRPLPDQEFERWSEVMAANYRQPLRDWFMQTARYEIEGYLTLSGAELIRLGYPQC